MPAAAALATSLWPAAAHAVLAVPDGRKGEAFVLMTQPDANSSALLSHARGSDATEVGVPRIVHVVDALPLLGTGKVDYVTAARLVAEVREAA